MKEIILNNQKNILDILEDEIMPFLINDEDSVPKEMKPIYEISQEKIFNNFNVIFYDDIQMDDYQNKNYFFKNMSFSCSGFKIQDQNSYELIEDEITLKEAEKNNVAIYFNPEYFLSEKKFDFYNTEEVIFDLKIELNEINQKELTKEEIYKLINLKIKSSLLEKEEKLLEQNTKNFNSGYQGGNSA